MVKRTWHGLQSPPRDISWDATNELLLINPVPELQLLRKGGPTRAGLVAKPVLLSRLSPSQQHGLPRFVGLAAQSAEFHATFTLPLPSSSSGSGSGHAAPSLPVGCTVTFGIRLVHTTNATQDIDCISRTTDSSLCWGVPAAAVLVHPICAPAVNVHRRDLSSGKRWGW